ANRYTLETVKAVIQNVLKPMMLYAVDNGYILKNPCSRINLPKRNYLNHKQACSFKTLIKLWDYAKIHRLGFTVLVLATTGMRREELLGLTWRNVDLRKGMLFVCQVYTKTCTTGDCVLKEPKTRGSIRHIPLTDTVIELLQAHKRRQPKGYRFVVSIEGADRPMNPDNYSHMLKRWVKGAGIRQKLTAHIFRHYAVMCLRRMGYGLEDIAQFTGHTNLSTLRDYYTDFDDVKSPVLKRMVKDMNVLANKTIRHNTRNNKKWSMKTTKNCKEKDRQFKENRHFQ
ncbi:MAG: site-specific integrase, partial [Schwartzia succinivorans]|nr:site-specific integrase [Schwartzia succinivorans]